MASDGTLPNFVIIGAAKAGTTSLHHYLSLHPQIFMSRVKELYFFVDAENGGRFQRGLDWYRSNFQTSLKVIGESSPQYTLFPKISGVPARIRETLSDPKFIYIVRDPIDRILSDYVRNVDEYGERRSIGEIISDIAGTEYEALSRYYTQLSRYLEYFGREKMLVIVCERLRASPRRVLRQVFEFLEVEPEFWTEKFEEEHNTGMETRAVAPWFDAFVPKPVNSQLANPTWIRRSWHLQQLLRNLSKLGGRRIGKPVLTDEEDAGLQRFFRSEVDQLRDFLQDRLDEWRPYSN